MNADDMLGEQTDTNIAEKIEMGLQEVPVAVVVKSTDDLFEETMRLIQMDLNQQDQEIQKKALQNGVVLPSAEKNNKANETRSRIFKAMGIALGSGTILAVAGCSVTPMAVVLPQDMTAEAKEEAEQTQEAFVPTPTSEATLSPEEIREQRLNEIAEVVKENDNTFTIEQLNAYLQKYGTGWEGGIEALMEYYKGTLMPFQYYFLKKNYKESGVYPTSAPYRFSTERTMSDKNPFPTPEVVNEEMLGKITESLYNSLFFKNPDGTFGWDQEPGKYTVIIYITTQYDESGKPYDAFFTDRGDLSFEDAKGNVRNVSREDAINKNLSDEEMALFTDGVLAGIKERWTMFITHEDGSLEKRSNFKEVEELLRPATSSDTVAQEIN